MDDRESRIRARAERIWIEEGRPDGRANAHWEMAAELVAVEEAQEDTMDRIQENHEIAAPSASAATTEAQARRP